MLTRQKILLSFIKNAGNETSLIELVKNAFLMTQECSNKSLKTFYQFLPYRHGPYSFTLYHELQLLVESGFIFPPLGQRLELATNQITNRHSLEWTLEKEVQKIWRVYGQYDTWDLVDLIYEKYPWYTLLCKYEEKRLVQPPIAPLAVYTMGYEGLQVDGFLDRLLRHGIKRLIDVRFNPLSRKFGFSKAALSNFCRYVGIQYEHIPQVGIPPDLRKDLKSFEDYQQLFWHYERNILDNNNDVVQRIAELMKEAASVLVCQESNPNYCHRTSLAKRVAQITDLHIDDLGEVKWRNTLEQGCLLS